MSKHKPRVRLSVDDMPRLQRLPPDKQGMILQRLFKKACQDYGIMHMYKEHEFFISKSEKGRRKKSRDLKEKRNPTPSKEDINDERLF